MRGYGLQLETQGDEDANPSPGSCGATLSLRERVKRAASAALFVFAQRENFLYFSRCGITLSIPNRRFLSSS
jgi:hypothetical protein